MENFFSILAGWLAGWPGWLVGLDGWIFIVFCESGVMMLWDLGPPYGTTCCPYRNIFLDTGWLAGWISMLFHKSGVIMLTSPGPPYGATCCPIETSSSILAVDWLVGWLSRVAGWA